MEDRIELAEYEEKAKELVGMTFAIYEQRAAHETHPPSPVSKAMASAVLSVQESVNTFLAVSSIPDSKEA